MFKKLINPFEKPQPKIKKPLIAIPRFPCPFYGFFDAFGIAYMDQRGNHCPLIGHICKMENNLSGPDWRKCLFNCPENKKTIDQIVDRHSIAPDEFWPEGQSSWKGIPFKSWMDYVMDPETPRPVTSKMSETTAEAENNH
jgi:hypothetical protein